MAESPRPEDWSYTCGRISAREPYTLLAPTFLDAVLDSEGIESAHELISQSSLRDSFPAPPDLRDYEARLDRLMLAEALDVAETAPSQALVGFFLWPDAFSGLRRDLTDLAKAAASRAEVVGRLRQAYGADPALAGLSEVMGEEEFVGVEYEEGAGVASRVAGVVLSLDANLLRALALAAGLFRTLAPQVAEYLEDFVSGKLAEAAARALHSGAGDDDLVARLAAGPVAELLGERAQRRPATPQEAVEAFAPPAVREAMARELREGQALDLDALAFWVESALVDRLAGAARVPFGPERAFQYLAVIRAQIRNAKLALSAVVQGLDREEVRRRLRDYAHA